MQARLYLQSKSEKRFTYTPDWVQCETKLNNKKVLITMALIGDTDYSLHGLDCELCKYNILHIWRRCYETHNSSAI